MTPQELKNSILQLAIQGKLVEQRAEEGTAEELYQQIQEEKQRLIAEKKIKKEKPLPEITEDEKPFDIPDSWKWVRFGNIANIVSARRVHQSDWENHGVPFYRAREIAKLATDGFVDNELFISEELYNKFSKSGVPSQGDLMITAVGTLGKSYIVQENDKFYYKDASVICLENYAKLSPDFLKFVMESEMMIKQIRSNSTGTTVATLTMVRMLQYLLPLPPLAEQKRIVEKIEQILPHIDQYEKAWGKLETFNKRFPDDMKKSLLQYAIEGKLVEQRAEEGTAEELYQQIQEEKQRLIAEKKIKKEKPLPEITEDKIPFDIPDSWKWVRLLSVVDIATNLVQPSEYAEYMHIAPDNIEKGTGRLFECQTVAKDKVTSANHLFKKGQIIYSKIRPLLRKAVIAPFDGLCSADMYPLNTTLNRKYVLYYLLSDVYNIQIAEAMSSRVKMPKINQNELSKILIPLPPLAEQKRIVEKLEQMLPLCERLK